MSKITGTQDFSGQDSGTVEGTPEAEVRTNHDGGTAGVNSQVIHDLSNPDRHTVLHVLSSDDPRLHLSRMSGQEPPNPVGYRGPDRRPI